MVVYFNIEYFFDCFFNVLDSGITKFLHLSGICEDDMVMLTIKIGLFVLGLVFAKLVFSHQSALQKEFDSVVECCPAYPVIFVFHGDVQ